MSTEPATNQPPNDAVLISLVTLCNKFDIGVGITLLVKGKIVTGITTSVKDFTEASAKNIESQNQGKTGDIFATIYKKIGEAAVKNIEEDGHVPELIHLKDASIHDGTAVHNVGWWRGKISSVDGHSLGIMTS